MPTPKPDVNPHESRRIRGDNRIVILPPPSTEKIAWTGRGR